jgi:hypothetical protein
MMSAGPTGFCRLDVMSPPPEWNDVYDHHPGNQARIAGRKYNFGAESRSRSKVIERLHPPGR